MADREPGRQPIGGPAKVTIPIRGESGFSLSMSKALTNRLMKELRFPCISITEAELSTWASPCKSERLLYLTGRVLESRIESYNVRTQSTRLQCCYEANKVWSG